MQPIRIGLVVGEKSGEKLAAGLVQQIKKRIPNVEIYGVIGKELNDLGCQPIAHMEKIAVMGFVEPLLRLPELLKFRRWVLDHFLNEPPDLFIGVDAPDFNLYLEKRLKAAGVPTVHYVSPSVWAWREYRVKSIKQSVDLMLNILPFEKKFYDKHGVNSTFVGHPAADRVEISKDSFSSSSNQLSFTETLKIALLPGSRKSEIKNLLPLYLETIKSIAKSLTGISLLIPAANDDCYELIEVFLQKSGVSDLSNVSVKVVLNDMDSVISACDIAIVTSGTATLEVMLHKKPMVICYKTSWINFLIAKMLVKVKYIGLPNLISDKPVVKELIQNDLTVYSLEEELKKLIGNKEYKEKQISEFTKSHLLLKQNASNKAAMHIFNLMGWSNQTPD